MIDRYKKQVAMTLILASLFLLEGCTAAVMGAGEQAYSHLRGDLLGIVPEPLEEAYPASLKAVKSLEGYDLTGSEVNTLAGQITAYGPNARKVQVDLSRTDHNQTRVSIRIGLIGDKVRSVQIYDRIQHYLHSPSGDRSIL